MPIRKLASTIIIFLFTAILIISAQDDGNNILPPTENIFGIVEGIWFPELTCELHPGWERLIFDWASHQPEGPDDWVGFLNIDDRWLQSASDCDREVIAVIKNVPAWATDGSPVSGIPRGLNLPIDDPNNVWANFMRRTAEYYASRGVQRFIILNEPDIQPGTYGFEFEGTLEDYFQMVKVAYLAAKQGNPAASIHLAGTTFWHDANSGERLYTDRLLERISQDPNGPEYDYYFDALSLHVYFRTDSVYDIVNTYRDLLNKYGFGDKAIWIVETNASPNLDPSWQVIRPQFQITLEQQASFLAQAAALGLAAGADRIGVYKLYDQQLPDGGESFGLLHPADGTPRPAFYSWQTVIERFNNVENTTLYRNERVTVAQLQQYDDQQTIVAWSRTGETTWLEIAATSDKAYLLNQYGAERIIRPSDNFYTLDLPGASCEEVEGCVVGGAVSILIQPLKETGFFELHNGERMELSIEEPVLIQTE
jgi:hypothetical protein